MEHLTRFIPVLIGIAAAFLAQYLRNKKYKNLGIPQVDERVRYIWRKSLLIVLGGSFIVFSIYLAISYFIYGINSISILTISNYGFVALILWAILFGIMKRK
jgi:hypothetical protein